MLFLEDATISCISHVPLAALEGCLPSLVEWPLKILFASPFTACADNPAIDPLLTYYNSWEIFAITISLNMHVVNLKILDTELDGLSIAVVVWR